LTGIVANRLEHQNNWGANIEGGNIMGLMMMEMSSNRTAGKRKGNKMCDCTLTDDGWCANWLFQAAGCTAKGRMGDNGKGGKEVTHCTKLTMTDEMDDDLIVVLKWGNELFIRAPDER
jgi:hypothetical protein